MKDILLFLVVFGFVLSINISDVFSERLCCDMVMPVSIDRHILGSNYYFNIYDEYKSDDKYLFLLNDSDKISTIYKLFDNSNSICFLGDSITAGSANDKYPWYYEIYNMFPDKRVYNFSRGGYTARDLVINFSDDISSSNCDLFVINIGTNDIGNNLINEKEYLGNIKKIINLIDKDKKIILLSPFRRTNRDLSLRDNEDIKLELYDKYDYELEKLSFKNGNIYYKNVNTYIQDAINDLGEELFIMDGIHPNNRLGIKLYYYALFR